MQNHSYGCTQLAHTPKSLENQGEKEGQYLHKPPHGQAFPESTWQTHDLAKNQIVRCCRQIKFRNLKSVRMQ